MKRPSERTSRWALVAFFLRHDIGLEVRQALTHTAPALDADLDALERRPAANGTAADAMLRDLGARIGAIETSLQIDATSERKMLIAVAIASAIATLCWGFGDVAAAALKQAPAQPAALARPTASASSA